MAWYKPLFNQIYESPVGDKALAAIEYSARSGNLEAAFLCYLAIRKFERVASAYAQNDEELRSAIGSVLVALEALGYQISAEERQVLNQIFYKNGFDWANNLQTTFEN